MSDLAIFLLAFPSFMAAILVAVNYINDELKGQWI